MHILRAKWAIVLAVCLASELFVSNSVMISQTTEGMELREGSASEAGFVPEELARVDSLMAQAISDSVFPGAVLLIARKGIIVKHAAYGKMGYGEFDRPVQKDAIYDLASLTKVVATTTAAMLLCDRGRLNLDARVRDYLPAFSGAGKDRVTVRHLLAHVSGLPPFRRYYLQELAPGEMVQKILQEPLEYPPATESQYSDLGMILLGKIIEKLAGTSLDQFVAKEVFALLGMRHTFFNPPRALLDKIAPTEDDPWRGRVVHGAVHDENAFALGGVAGHAGLFSTAGDLAKFLQMLLNGGAYGSVKILSGKIIRQFTRPQNLVPGSSRALGWDTARSRGNSSGRLMSARAFGHTGFTGTSVWVDPENEVFVILLSNRVHPSRKNRKIIRFRPQLHDAVMAALQKQVSGTERH